MAERYHRETSRTRAHLADPKHDSRYRTFAEDEPRYLKLADRPDQTTNKHRRAKSYNPQPLPIEGSDYWTTRRRAYDREFEKPSYRVVYEPLDDEPPGDEPPGSDARGGLLRPDASSKGASALRDRDLERIYSRQTGEDDWDRGLRKERRGQYEETPMKSRLREPSRNRLSSSQPGTLTVNVGDGSRAGRAAVVDWFLSTPANNDAQSTSTEAVLDTRGSRPSQSYFRTPRSAPREIIPQGKAVAAVASNNAWNYPRPKSPAYSNTSTETIVADNRRGHSTIKYDRNSQDEEKRTIQYEDLMKRRQHETIGYQQAELRPQLENAERPRQEKIDQIRHGRTNSAILHEELQKLPKGMKETGRKWGDQGYGRPLRKVHPGDVDPESIEDLRDQRREFGRNRSRSVGWRETRGDEARSSDACWAYSGLPVNRSMRNSSVDFSDNMSRKPVPVRTGHQQVASANTSRNRDMIEHGGRDSRGPRPASPDWTAEYMRDKFRHLRKEHYKHRQAKDAET
ncbi:MAG: hypothetical protein M1821_009169 [Bathelium mastoideum]|nr:MAG: hypothetical protein M1821_009169 [Bathelium mastoideum]